VFSISTLVRHCVQAAGHGHADLEIADLDLGLLDAVEAAHFLNLGAKGEGRRNLELGLLSRDDLLLDEVQAFFDAIWRGQPCSGCKLRDECPQPLG
jgi:hypothetical protein